MKITISHIKKMIFIILLFLLSDYPASFGMDKIWLNDGTVLEGEISEITAPGKVVMTLPWSENHISVRTEYITRMEIMPRTVNISPNFIVGLTNGVIFPCTLLSIDNANLKITTVDVQEQTIPLPQVSFFSSFPKSNCFFYGISNRWDLSKWEGQKDAWLANANGLQSNPFYTHNRTLILPLTDKKARTLLRFCELIGGTLLLGRRKIADGYNYLKLEIELADYIGYVCCIPEIPNNTASSHEFYLPCENFDLWIFHHDDTVELFLEGVKIFSCSLPAEYEPIIGFTETCAFSLYEMRVYSGVTATKMSSMKPSSKTRVMLTNNDVLSVQSLSLHNNSVLLELYENTIKIPIEKISAVWFPHPTSAEPKYTIEILLNGSVQSFAERIINLKNGYLIVQDKEGSTYSLPCIEPVNIFISPDHTVTGARNILKTFTDAVIKKDFCVLNNTVISSVDVMLSMFAEGILENFQKFEITPVNDTIVGKEASIEINIRMQFANREEKVEKGNVFIFRHKGRWYIFIPSQ